jgi:hypothetical protein
MIYNDPTTYTIHRWRRPKGCYPRWAIIHDPANDDASPTATWRYLRHNTAQSCYHRLLWVDAKGPSVAVLAPWGEYVGHAGVSTRIPGTAIANTALNYWTVSISVCTYGRPTPPGSALFELLADQCTAAVRECRLPDAGVILAHREISTVRGRRSDPRGIDMVQLRAAVHDRLTNVV